MTTDTTPDILKKLAPTQEQITEYADKVAEIMGWKGYAERNKDAIANFWTQEKEKK